MAIPLHTKSVDYQRRGLFDGVRHFSELEQRIEALSDEQQRGDAFEVFTEAYFATQRPHDAHTLWPQSAAPVAVLQSLGLTVQDNGVDGVLQSPVGLLSVYQAKFRSGRTALTWRELSTFIGLADSSQIHSRILFTNSDDIPALMNERRGFFCIRGADLERLDELDFVAMERWLAGAPVDVPKKEPLPHQQEAIAALLPALEQHGRATAVMACGTGKTLVSLWVAERSQATTILVLLPSLALVRQTLHEWLHETRWPSLAYLCVCSDPTVASDVDSLSVTQTDLDFEVNTDGKTVRAFLDADFQGTRLVFCTYQSAHIVAAAMGDGEAFDLGIFDEAHKTAGRVGVRFAFAVADQNLLIRKRLFLTATPRHYDYRKKDKEGDAKLVYSMDVPEVYGPTVVKLTFAEAARQQIICPYKVLISVVTSAMVNSERLRRGEVIIDGDRVRAIQVANQIALQKAVAEFRVSKIFTFHRSIKSAESFTGEASEGIATHLPDFARLHVNGNMSTAVRDGLMRSFAEAPKAVMSNARCLTEGVDVPAVDMVAFLTPKRSLVEIVQATGRAIRRSPNKQFGYVLVPLFLEQHDGESIEDALARTKFRDVWNVLGAMLEQDDLFAQVIRQMREDRGERGGYDDSTFHELVEVLGENIPLDTIRRHITVVSMDRFGFSWDEWYGQLKAFKAANGHCNVRRADEPNRQLNSWVQTQRNFRRTGRLSEERIQRLDLLGFKWGSKEIFEQSRAKRWNRRLKELSEYKTRFGNCDVPGKWTENPTLGHWVSNVRRRRTHLSDSEIASLDELGFTWIIQDELDEAWPVRLEQLAGYKARFGDCNVSATWNENRSLGIWVNNVRALRKAGRLSAERITELDGLGFVWSIRKRTVRRLDWDEMHRQYVELQKSQARKEPTLKQHPTLTHWVAGVRRNKAAGNLSDDQIKTMDAIGFVWTTKRERSESMISALVNYQQTHGDFNVPPIWPENPKLTDWVRRQQKKLRDGTIQPKLQARLNAIGFVCLPEKADPWEAIFAALVEFKRQHGHCKVARNYRVVPELGRWVNSQRFAKQKGKLDGERTARLDAIGFIWNAIADTWEKMFEELKQYKTTHGNCDVPTNRPPYKRLASWINQQHIIWQALQEGQRKARRHTLSRMKQLEEIGIDFGEAGSHEARWEENFVALQQYKAQNGDCNVPSQSEDHPNLAAWVSNQRTRMKAGKLPEHQIARLTELGFIWSLHEFKWQRMYDALVAYKQRIGHCWVPCDWPENPRLASWVTSQRNERVSGKLSEERFKLLDAIGFVWSKDRSSSDEIGFTGSLHDQKWQRMFDELVKYKQQHGHCDVPMNWPSNPRLSGWVSSQRTAKRTGQLLSNRLQRLDELGFIWQKNRGRASSESNGDE